MSLKGLWHHSDFVKFWTAQTISFVGSQVTLLALPLTAVLVLNATPAQMGFLTAIEAVPSLLVGLFAGVWIDRHRHRPVLIIADLGRALLLFAIPMTALLGILRMEYLYLIAFLVGTLGLFFEVAHSSFLPTLVGREQLVEGNSKLEVSRSVAEIAGPGIAGWLIQLVSAPIAIVVDAISFIFSALFLWLIRTPETAPTLPDQTNIWNDIAEGFRLVFNSKILRAVAGCIGMVHLFNSILETVFILYLTRTLGIEAGLLGFIFAAGSVGFLVGASMTGWVTRRLGLGPALIAGLLLTGSSDLLIPLVNKSMTAAVVVVVLVVAQFFFGLGLTNFNIGQVSLRQAVTPDAMQGRMNAMMSFIAWGIVPLGGLLGGWLGEMAGVRQTLFIAALGEILAALWLIFSPIRSRKH